MQDRVSPIVTVDICAFSIVDEHLKVLMVEREESPFAGRRALPGGFVRPSEDSDLSAAASRILKSKAGLEPRYLEQVESVGNENRDPRGWSLTVLTTALYAEPVGDAERWIHVDQARERSVGVFDHGVLIAKALARLRAKAGYTAHPLFLLAPTFTLVEAQIAFEICLGRTVEKKAFRRRLLEASIIEERGVCTEWRGRGPKPMMYSVLADRARDFIFPRAIETG